MTSPTARNPGSEARRPPAATRSGVRRPPAATRSGVRRLAAATRPGARRLAAATTVVRRLVAAIAVLLLALPSVAAAQQPQPFDRGTARACPRSPSDAFTDDQGSVHEAAINCVAFWKVALGVSATTYAPDRSVTRAQMASFIARMMEVAAFRFPESPPDAFDDDKGDPHEGNINRLAAAGVVKGTGVRQYSPSRSVTRAQMASFISNAIATVTESRPTTNDDFFTDDEQSPHEGNINGLASIGVVQGTGGGRYQPLQPVNRAAMASFIARGADFLAERGFWPPPPFEVTPADAAAFQLNTTREFDATVESGAIVDIRLFRAEDVKLDGATVVFELSPDTPSTTAREQPSPARIVAIEGSAAASQEVNEVRSDGLISFSGGSSEFADVVPVVWDDANGNNRVDVNEAGRPTERVGVGGRTTFIPPEAEQGAHSPVVAALTNIDLDLLVSNGGRTFEWDPNDAFQYQTRTITQAEFESMLNPDDVLTIDYQPDLGLRSTFTVEVDIVHAPPAPAATVVDADKEGVKDDVSVSFTLPDDNSAGTAYKLQRAPAECASGATDERLFQDLADAKTSPSLDMNPPPGCYRYRLRGSSPVSNNQTASAPSNMVRVPEPAPVDAERPRIVDVRATSVDNLVGTGDTHTFRFSEPMHPDTAKGLYRLFDADGTAGDVVCDGNPDRTDDNASCELDPVGFTLTVTLRDPTIVGAGAQTGIAYPATISEVSSQFKDLAGNPLNLTEGDKEIQRG